MHNSITVEWWGITACLDESNTTKLLTIIDSGSDAAALFVLLDPEIKSKVVIALCVALVKVGAKVIKGIDEAGGKQGVCLSRPWIGPIPGWVVAQSA